MFGKFYIVVRRPMLIVVIVVTHFFIPTLANWSSPYLIVDVVAPVFKQRRANHKSSDWPNAGAAQRWPTPTSKFYYVVRRPILRSGPHIWRNMATH